MDDKAESDQTDVLDVSGAASWDEPTEPQQSREILPARDVEGHHKTETETTDRPSMSQPQPPQCLKNISEVPQRRRTEKNGRSTSKLVGSSLASPGQNDPAPFQLGYLPVLLPGTALLRVSKQVRCGQGPEVKARRACRALKEAVVSH